MYRRTGLSRWSALLIAIVVGSVIIASAGVAAQGTPDVSPVAAGGGLASIPVAPGSEQAGADPEAEVTLNLGAEIDSGDPQAGVAFLNEIEISSKVFTPLVALTAENEVADAGATAMEVSEDGTVYTFTIRAGMTYTDGVPVTADNYAWAIRRACDPNVGGVYSNILYAIVGCQAWREADVATADLAPLQAAVEESITALDAQTLQITLTQASGYFPYVMATWVTYPSRQDLVEAGGATWWQSPETYIGNGPFTLASHSPGEEWVFERNEAYFRGSPGIARLVFREIDNTQTEFLAYQQGELDLIAPAASFLPQIEADPDLTAQFHRAVGANTYYFAFNMSAPPFDNLQVRQAFAAALNRDQYIDQIRGGVGQPAGSFLYEGLPGYQTGYQQTYDPERAKALLAEAGYPDGEGFPQQQLRYIADDAASQQQATFWQQNIQDVLGIELELVPLESTELQSLRTNRDPSLTIYLANWFEDYPHPQNWLSLVFGPGSTRSPLGWDDPAYNDLVTQADALPIEEAIPLYQQADAYLMEQAPIAPYFHNENLVLIQPSFQGYVTYPTSVADTIYQVEKIYKTES